MDLTKELPQSYIIGAVIFIVLLIIIGLGLVRYFKNKEAK
jgi:predicted lipase